MMKTDNYRLIAEVAKRRTLWDTTIAVSDRRDELIIHWASVANILKQDGKCPCPTHFCWLLKINPRMWLLHLLFFSCHLQEALQGIEG